jgi:chromosome segregation protein
LFKVKKLKISGFKSFAFTCEFEISDGVTGIVGPNGCGKSNIFEAIRWVMGESSSKSLRSNSMDEVIFNGTDKIPAKNFAEVSLELEATKKNDD